MADLPPPPESPPTQVPPPAQPPRRGGMRWVLIGAGGCLVLLLLVFVGFTGCLAAIVGSGGGGDGGGGEVGYDEAKEQAVPIGETVEAGDVAWTVNNVTQATELSALGQRKQGNFVIIDVTFINNGSEPVTLDSASLAILDDQGRTHETDPDASMYVNPNRDLFLNQVNPGVTKEGRAIFDVAPDAKGLILRAGDTDPFSDENAYVNLGI
jgi:Domain of unknown function (DUF4352)